MSLESILDTESVAVDQNQITLRIKPGVYQKRPDVIMAERDAARFVDFKKNDRISKMIDIYFDLFKVLKLSQK